MRVGDDKLCASLCQFQLVQAVVNGDAFDPGGKRPFCIKSRQCTVCPQKCFLGCVLCVSPLPQEPVRCVENGRLIPLYQRAKSGRIACPRSYNQLLVGRYHMPSYRILQLIWGKVASCLPQAKKQLRGGVPELSKEGGGKRVVA